MKKFTLFCCVLYILNAIEAAWVDYSAEEWNLFKKNFSKSYNSKDEEKFRFDVFMKNKRITNSHNEKFRKGEVTYKMGINDFSDLNDEELVKMKDFDFPRIKGSKVIKKDTIFYETQSKFIAPPSIDWRQKKAITKVRHQGNCSSCWAFSVVGALEAQYFIKHGKLVSLSEQNLLDCTSGDCDGGNRDNTFRYVNYHGIATADSYPYKGYKGQCKHDLENNSGVKLIDFRDVPPREEELKKAVAEIGPISISILSTSSFNRYREGIYYEPNCESENQRHAMLLVGYGTEKDGRDYWLVKNSWGEKWGMNGYGKIARNKDNHCKIASYATYPVIM